MPVPAREREKTRLGRRLIRTAGGIALGVLVLAGAVESAPCRDSFARTELFFGSATPDGAAVTDEDFRAFLEHEITPRFPDGLTLLAGSGGFRNASGAIVRERSYLLILVYPLSGRASDDRIEQIRELYKTRFHQESVLRVDSETARVCF